MENLELYRKAVELWQSKKITSSAELMAAMSGIIVAFAYHSGKLENERITYHDTREIFERDAVSSYTGDLRTLFEIRNARDASEHIIQAFNQKRAIDMDFLKEVQYELTKNTYDKRRYGMEERPGTFKRHDYVTGREEVGALPEDVPDEIQELLQELPEINTKKDNVLVGAAYFHAKFENIHPFADGNGRTGRLLTNYLLILHDHPPLVFREEDRKQYYAALEAWDKHQNLVPMKGYLMEETARTWEKQVARQSSSFR